VRLLIGALTVCCLVGCPNRSQIILLTEPDRIPVEVGHYPDYVEVLYGQHAYGRQLAAIRKDIEAHESILRRLVRERIALKAPLEFEFKYAAVDTSRTRLILRYFAPDPAPQLTAGWEVFLVYALPRYRLMSAWVAAVPLE